MNRVTRPRWPTYRWDCLTCEEWEAVGDGWYVALRHAKGHSEDRGHEVAILEVRAWIEPPPELPLHNRTGEGL